MGSIKLHLKRLSIGIACVALLGLASVSSASATLSLTASPKHEAAELAWPDIIGSNGFYSIYRDGSWQRFVNAPASGWTDTGVSNGTTYQYEVEAYSNTGGGTLVDSSATVQVTPPGVGFDCFDIANLATGERPPSCWRPFADSSPFNRTISSSPTLDANSNDIVSYLTSGTNPSKLSSNTGGATNDFWHANYFAKPTDPLYTVHCTEPWGTCEPEGDDFRIPADAKPAGYLGSGSSLDHHISVVQPDGVTTLDLWESDTPSGTGGTLDASWGGVSEIDGSGLGSDATAAQFGGFAGAIRAQELAAGQINHALFAVVRCTSGHVYPAGKGAYQCGDPDAPPNGARLQLDMSEGAIEALSVPRWKKTILHALRRYGMIVGDTGGGSAAFGLQFESGMVDRAFSNPEQMDQFAITAGVTPYYNSTTGRDEHVFDIAPGVDWANDLRVVAPCVSYGTC